MPAIETATFTAAGATQKRRLDAYLGDVVNVKGFGATGDNATDDHDAIQAAFDYAFGTSSAPHGNNTALNKPVFFPNGTYRIGSTLNLTAVKNGHIFGTVNANIYPTTAMQSAAMTMLAINGMEDTLIENIGVGLLINNNAICIDLNWDGGTPTNFGVGLGNNLFKKVYVAGGGRANGNTGWRIANSGNGGAGNGWWNSLAEQCTQGYHVIGADAFGQAFQAICGGAENDICWKVDNGSVMVTGISNAGGGNPGQLDFQVNGPATIVVQGGRSEASRFLELNHAEAVAYVGGVGCGNYAGANNVIMVEGSTLVADLLKTFRLIGEGTLYCRGRNFDISGFTGTGPNAPDPEQDI